MIEFGYCQCGCGNKTNLVLKSDRIRGTVKGQPRRFLKGHYRLPQSKPPVVDPSTGCWNWGGKLRCRGYPGLLAYKGKRAKAHRVFYMRAKGPIPEGMQLDHLCKNPKCVNPDHLEPVTGKENMRRSSRTKLILSQAMEVREAARLGPISTRYFADKFGVTTQTIRCILKGKIWN